MCPEDERWGHRFMDLTRTSNGTGEGVGGKGVKYELM